MEMLQTLKGFRDFLPKEARKRNFVIGKLRQTFESFGFEPLETPALEYEEVLSGKYGEEGQKLMYRFTDAGDRAVAMRYDQTVPLARVVAQYQNDLPLPFKRYQIQNVWRAENTQKGRYREFLQCDIDTVGTKSLFADAEVIASITKAMENLGIVNFKVLINDRSVFEGIDLKAIRVMDKLKKVGRGEVLKELLALGLDEQSLTKIEDMEAPESIKTIFAYLRELGIEEEKVRFSPTLARGLDYYTGTIFEVEIDGYLVGSVAGGGRYDNLIGNFGNSQIPAVGGAFGFDRLIEAMEEMDLFPTDLTTSEVLVTISKQSETQALRVALELRNNDVNVDLYPDLEVAVDKQLKYADKKGIPMVVLFQDDQAILKDMESGEKSQTSIEELIKKLS